MRRRKHRMHIREIVMQRRAGLSQPRRFLGHAHGRGEVSEFLFSSGLAPALNEPDTSRWLSGEKVTN